MKKTITYTVITDPVERAEWMRGITEANDQITLTRGVLENKIVDAYKAGLTWTRIGMALRVSRQAAQQRFGRLVEEWDERQNAL